MKLYLVTYDLKNKSKDYNKLYEKIKALGTWWHYLESTWIVQTTKDSAQIASDLNSVIDPVDDSLLVIAIDKNDKQGWLPKDAWQWINTK